LKAKANKDGVLLDWTSTADKKIEKILVYKSINNEPMRLYQQVSGSHFVDTATANEFGITVKYRIKAVYEDGSTSNFSNEAKANN
jgi:hypothetical protein